MLSQESVVVGREICVYLYDYWLNFSMPFAFVRAFVCFIHHNEIRSRTYMFVADIVVASFTLFRFFSPSSVKRNCSFLFGLNSLENS